MKTALPITEKPAVVLTGGYVPARTAEKRRNHKFDVFDVCEKCGVERKKIPYVGSGFNASVTNRFITHYSQDGKTFSTEFINCK